MWAFSLDVRASLLGACLEAAAVSIERAPDRRHEEISIQLVGSTLAIWDDRSTLVGTQDGDSNQAFRSRCLLPSLALLKLSQSRRLDGTHFAATRKQLERLITVQVVLPARALFTDKHGKKWKERNGVWTWPEIAPVVSDLEARLVPHDEKERGGIENVDADLTESLPLLFDLAIRVIPRSDLRRKQWEQPWIDALFLALAHRSCPKLLQRGPDGQEEELVTIMNTATEPESLTPIESMLDIALRRQMDLSLPVLGYLSAAAMVREDQPLSWGFLAKVIQINAHVVWPKSGLSTSRGCLDQLCTRIADATVTQEAYECIRDGVILPVMYAFARSRDLIGFMTVWRDNLEEAMRMRAGLHSNRESLPAVLVWDDEDVFDQFRQLAPLYAPPTLGKILFDDLLPPLSSMPQRVGSTLDIFSKMAIYSAFLTSSDWSTSTSHIGHGERSDLLRAVIEALSRRSDYQSQRWRLWRLLRCVIRISSDEESFHKVLQLIQSPDSFASLQRVGSLAAIQSDTKRASGFLECLECFSLLVELASRRYPDISTLMESEMKCLQEMFLPAPSQTFPTGGGESRVLWNGRCIDLNDQWKLASACVGRLMQSPIVITKDRQDFAALVSSLISSLGKSIRAHNQATNVRDMEQLVQVAITLEEVRNDPALRDTFNQHLLDDGQRESETGIRVLARTLSIKAPKKFRSKAMASAVTKHLINNAHSASIEDIANTLSLLERLILITNRSILEMNDWHAWIAVLDVLSKRNDLFGTTSYPIAIRCATSILETFWQRALASEKGSDSHRTLTDMVSWCTETVDSRPDFAYGRLSSFLALEVFMSHILDSKGEAISNQEQERLRQKYVHILTERLQEMLREDLSIENLYGSRAILQALSKVNHLSEAGVDLGRLITNVDAAVRDWETSAANSPGQEEQRLGSSIRRHLWRLSSQNTPHPPSTQVEAALEHMVRLVRSHSPPLTSDVLDLFSSEAGTFVAGLEPATRAHVLSLLRKEDWSRDLRLLCPITVASIVLATDTEQIIQHPEIASEFAAVACLTATPKNCTVSHLLLSLESSKLVLDLHPSIVNQSTVDTLLATICTLASASSDGVLLLFDGNNAESTQAATCLYDRFCALLASILGRFRRRVSDRYHLLLPAMQALLRCLFYPGKADVQYRLGSTRSEGARSFLGSLPQWMRDSDGPLPPSSVESFSRLLSSICNPTVSAARSSRKRAHSELNDETKKVRKLAGQHMQYLVMEYAKCMLDGRVSPEVKEKLMPGMYSVLDAMTRDLMGAMNAAMDPSSRAIFKNLYDDWTRFGKWDKS